MTRVRWNLFWDSLLNSLASLVAILTGMVALAVFYEVVTRYFFGRPTTWVLDFTEYAMPYVTFLGAAWALREQSHIRIDIVVERLSLRNQLFLKPVVLLLAATVTAVLTWLGTEATLDAYSRGHVDLRSWQVPRWLLLLPIPLGGLLLTIEFLRQFSNNVGTHRRGMQQ